jgi:hypothetical protein
MSIGASAHGEQASILQMRRPEPVSNVRSGCPPMTVAALKRRAENHSDYLDGS